MVQQRHHHRQQRGLLAAVHAAGGGEHAGRLAGQCPGEPLRRGAVQEVLERRGHVAEARGRAERQADAVFQVAHLRVGRAVARHLGLRGFTHGRDGRYRAHARLCAVHAFDALRDGFGQCARAAVAAVVQDEDVFHGDAQRGSRYYSCGPERASSAPSLILHAVRYPCAPPMECPEAACAAALCTAARGRGQPAAGGGQPDLHHGAVAGADPDGGVRAVHRVPDVPELSGGHRGLPVQQPRAGQHQPADPDVSQPVLAQRQGADGRRPGRPGRHVGDDHAHGRERPQRHLARAPAPAAGAARAGVLGAGQLRAGADRREPVGQLVPGVGLGGLRRQAAVWAGRGGGAGADPAVGHRVRHAVCVRAEHPRCVARCVSGGAGCRRGLRNRQARLRLLRGALSHLHGGLRDLCRAADLPAVDLRQLAGDAAGRDHRRHLTDHPPGLLAAPRLPGQ